MFWDILSIVIGAIAIVIGIMCIIKVKARSVVTNITNQVFNDDVLAKIKDILQHKEERTTPIDKTYNIGDQVRFTKQCDSVSGKYTDFPPSYDDKPELFKSIMESEGAIVTGCRHNDSLEYDKEIGSVDYIVAIGGIEYSVRLEDMTPNPDYKEPVAPDSLTDKPSYKMGDTVSFNKIFTNSTNPIRRRILTLSTPLTGTISGVRKTNEIDDDMKGWDDPFVDKLTDYIVTIAPFEAVEVHESFIVKDSSKPKRKRAAKKSSTEAEA